MVIYNLVIHLYVFAIRLAALAGNEKAKQWIEGRRGWREKISSQITDKEKHIWFHCSSLGEFEQGRPVIEKIKQSDSGSKIVLTFFSPSGYEIRKNYEHADYIFYLPIDTRKNAVDFINLIQPAKVFFVKYDYWFYFLGELSRKSIPVYFISSVFRSNHRFFKKGLVGSFFRKMLSCVSHFFVQNKESEQLLHSIGFNNVTVCGDTRFDRVVKIAANHREIEQVKRFTSSSKGNVLIAGSTWPQDEEVLIRLIKNVPLDFKTIIVPHEINHHHIGHLEYALIEKAGMKPDDIAVFSHEKENLAIARVYIIDTIGLLSSIYYYGDFAYVGGGFGKGIHNILEAAIYGMTVFFGPNYQTFPEAVELIKSGAAFPIRSAEELEKQVKRLSENTAEKEKAAEAAKTYVMQHAGATERILSYLDSR